MKLYLVDVGAWGLGCSVVTRLKLKLKLGLQASGTESRKAEPLLASQSRSLDV
jgi:hypothetical protein